MNLFLVRHTEIVATAEQCIGQSEVKLSEKGKADVVKLAEKLKSLAPNVVISSDLSRCRVLAEVVAKAVKAELVLKSAWREINFGQWEGKVWSEIDARDHVHYEAWAKDFVAVAPPEGESFSSLQARIARELNALSTYPAERIMVVTHAGAIRAAIASAINLPLERMFSIHLNYGALVQLRLNSGIWTLQDLNNSLLTLPCNQPSANLHEC